MQSDSHFMDIRRLFDRKPTSHLTTTYKTSFLFHDDFLTLSGNVLQDPCPSIIVSDPVTVSSKCHATFLYEERLSYSRRKEGSDEEVMASDLPDPY